MNDLTQNELLKNFIGSEKKYIHYCENNSKIAFNWAAFLFGTYWLLYRNFALAKVKKYMNNPRYSPEFFALYGGVTWGVPIIVLLAYSLFLFMSVAPLLMPKPQPVAIHVIEFG